MIRNLDVSANSSRRFRLSRTQDSRNSVLSKAPRAESSVIIIAKQLDQLRLRFCTSRHTRIPVAPCCTIGIMRPVRIPLFGFPDVVLHADELAVTKNPCYSEAKGGDADAADLRHAGSRRFGHSSAKRQTWSRIRRPVARNVRIWLRLPYPVRSSLPRKLPGCSNHSRSSCCGRT